MKKTRALVLLSGGLDSRLALLMMMELLGRENTEAVYFRLPFEAGAGRGKSVSDFAESLNVRLHIIDCTRGRLLQEYMDMVKNPEFGRGAALNPCIDCHIFILRKAGLLAEKTGIDILVTGEVLGQRPMSQYGRALSIVERESGFAGRILRPLSARLLPETEPEKAGLIDRSKLESIKGRQRKRQIQMAGRYNISYPAPAGGCLLCEKGFCKKMKPLMGKKDITETDIALAKIGRHFSSGRIVLGKNEEENSKLADIASSDESLMLIVPDRPGPSAVIRFPEDEKEARRLINLHTRK